MPAARAEGEVWVGVTAEGTEVRGQGATASWWSLGVDAAVERLETGR
jgi:hypothetical protein